MFTRVFNFWSDRLKTHPNSTNALFGGIVTGFGDCLAQRAEKHQHHVQNILVVPPSKNETETNQQQQKQQSSSTSVSYRSHDYNYKRTMIYSSLAFLVTPLWVRVLKITDKFVGIDHHKKIMDKSSLTPRALKFRAVKQGLLTWALGSLMVPLTVSYLTTTFSVFIHGVYDFQEIKRRITERLNRNFLTHISGSMCYWSIHWLPMFLWLPHEWRLVYGICANVVWQMIVSFLQHRP